MKQFKRDENQNSNKLHLDKYYTSSELAEYCINKTFEIIGRGNIKEIIEPSAGNGSFSNQIESWEEQYLTTATPNLLQWQVYKYIKEQIPEIN